MTLGTTSVSSFKEPFAEQRFDPTGPAFPFLRAGLLCAHRLERSLLAALLFLGDQGAQIILEDGK